MPTYRMLAILVVSLALSLFAVPAAAMASTSATGWVRIAHLSPDTKAVDVRLASLGGSSTALALDHVSYGAVSAYKSLPVGTYAVTMRAAGSAPTSTPVVQTSVTVQAGGAYTVAVFGTNAHLQTKVVQDALTLPKGGDVRVRTVQASTSSAPVTVTAEPASTVIIADAAIGTVSDYADVQAGTYTLEATSGSRSTSAQVTLKPGQIMSVFVLDDASGGFALRTVLDSASVGAVPKGYLATGGGYLAHQAEQQQTDMMLAGGGLGLLAAAGATAGIVVRRRRARA